MDKILVLGLMMIGMFIGELVDMAMKSDYYLFLLGAGIGGLVGILIQGHTVSFDDLDDTSNSTRC